MEKQTAVEWFSDNVWKLKSKLENKEITLFKFCSLYFELYEQAKEMEKEQIMDAFNKGLSFAINPIPKPEDAKNYYKKSIKKTNDTRRKSKGII
jgi:hypothetical protein